MLISGTERNYRLKSGYGAVGAVVGAHIEQAKVLTAYA